MDEQTYSGLFDDPLPYPGSPGPTVDLGQFPDPFSRPEGDGANVSLPPLLSKDPFQSKLTAAANRPASFQTLTEPGSFDWEGTNADRYINSSYYRELGFNPNRDNETIYGNRQTFGDTLSNAFAGAGSLAWNTFVDGWKGWGRLVDALVNRDASRVMGTPEELAELDKQQKEIMNKYAIFRTPESESSIFNRQFLGDMIQQSGFAVGAVAQFAAEELLTMGAAAAFKPLTGARALNAIVKGVKIGEVTADLKRIDDMAWKGQQASRLYKGLQSMAKYTPVAGNLIDSGLKFWRATKEGTNVWELGGITLNGLRRTMAEANMAFTESRMEAAGTYVEIKNKLYEQTLEEKGTVSAFDEQHIEQMAQGAAWSNFKVNAATISIMNRLQFDNLFRKFGANKRAAQELEEAGENVLDKPIERKLYNKVTGTPVKQAEAVAGAAAAKTGEKLTQFYEKGVLGTFGNLSKIAADFGRKKATWEASKSIGRNMFKWEVDEGLQELIQEGSNIAVQDYYTSLYNFGKGDKGDSVDKALDGIYNTNGLKIFLMGAMTGRLISPLNHAFGFIGNRVSTNPDQRKAAKADIKTTITTINDFFKNPANYAPEAIANLKVQNRASEVMEQALADNNKYIYEHAKDSSFAKAVTAAKKMNMLESLTDTIGAYGDHFNEQEFREAFGVDFNDENRKTVKQYMTRLGTEIKTFSDRYDQLRTTYADVIKPERYSEKDRGKVLLAKRALDESVELLATSEYRAGRAAKRGLEIMEEAAKIPGVGNMSYLAFRTMGDNEAIRNEKDLLKGELEADAQGLDNESERGSKEIKERMAHKQKQLKALEIFEENLPFLSKAEASGGKLADMENMKPVKDMMNAMTNYFISKNQEEGHTTQFTQKDISDLFFRLNDFRNLEDDKKKFLDIYSLVANSKKFIEVYLRRQEVLTNLRKEKTEEQIDAVNQAEKENNEATKLPVGTRQGDTDDELGKEKEPGTEDETDREDESATKGKADAGDKTDDEDVPAEGELVYKDFRVGDKVRYKDKERDMDFDISTISAEDGIELRNRGNNKTKFISFEKFDAMLGNGQLKKIEKPQKFRGKLNNKNITVYPDGKEGVFIAKLVLPDELPPNNELYMVVDDKGSSIVEGGISTREPYTRLEDAEGQRDKLVALRIKNKEAAAKEKAKELKDEEKKEQGRQSSQEKQGGQGENNQGGRGNQVNQGGRGNQVNQSGQNKQSNRGNEASEKVQESEPEDKRFKLRIAKVHTRVYAHNGGEGDAKASEQFQQLLRTVPYKELMGNLVIRVTKNKKIAQPRITQRGKEEENPNLWLYGEPYQVQLIYKGKPIGYLTYFDRYQYVKNGSVVPVSRLTISQFKEFFDVSTGIPEELLMAYKTSYKEGEKIYRTLIDIFEQGSREGIARDSISIEGEQLKNVFNVIVSEGEYDWLDTPVIPFKDLQYNSVNGVQYVLMKRREYGSNGAYRIAELPMLGRPVSAKPYSELMNKIRRERIVNGEDVTVNMGSYLAAVELPNGKVKFVELTTPAMKEEELEDVVARINQRSKETKENNLVEKTQEGKLYWGGRDITFNDKFNREISERLFVSVPRQHKGVYIDVAVNPAGNLQMDFHDKRTKLPTTERIILKNADDQQPLNFGNFQQLLTAINDKIKEHDRNLKYGGNQLGRVPIKIELGGENFKKHLDRTAAFSEINNMLVNVGQNVVKNISLSLTAKNDIGDGMNIVDKGKGKVVTTQKEEQGLKPVLPRQQEVTKDDTAAESSNVNPAEKNLSEFATENITEKKKAVPNIENLANESTKEPVAEVSTGERPDTSTTEDSLEKADVFYLPLSEIYTDTARFQPRGTAFSEVSVNKIIENFDNNRLDPVVVFRDKDGLDYILSGHSRLEAHRELEKLPDTDPNKQRAIEKGFREGTIKARYFEGTEKEAREFADRSNDLGTKNKDYESAVSLRKMREELSEITESKIIARAKEDFGRNWRYIYSLSHLNPAGKIIITLRQFENNPDKEAQSKIEKAAQWIGIARERFKDLLTDQHENEMFDFLMDKNKATKLDRESDFLGLIQNIVGRFDYNKVQLLNLYKIKNKSVGELSHETEEKEIQQAIKEKQKELDGLNDRFNNPNNIAYVSPNAPDYEDVLTIADKKRKEIAAMLVNLRKELLDHRQKRGAVIAAGMNQVSLFDLNNLTAIEQGQLDKELAPDNINIENIEQHEQENNEQGSGSDPIEVDVVPEIVQEPGYDQVGSKEQDQDDSKNEIKEKKKGRRNKKAESKIEPIGGGVVEVSNEIQPADELADMVEEEKELAGDTYRPTETSKILEEINGAKEALPAIKAAAFKKYKAQGMSMAAAFEAVEKDPLVLQTIERATKAERRLSAFKIIPSDVLSSKDIVHIKRFKRWVKKNLPKSVGVKNVNLAAENMIKKGTTVGRFIHALEDMGEGKTAVKGTIEVSKRSPYKYHEAFHAVFRLLLNDGQIDEYLNLARKEVTEVLKEKGTTLDRELKKLHDLNPEFYGGMERAELEERYHEEYLADRFDEWKVNKAAKTSNIFKMFFRLLRDWIDRIRGRKTASEQEREKLDELEGLFYDINARKFRDAAVVDNRFTEDLQPDALPQVALKDLEIDVELVEDEDGNVISMPVYLSQSKGAALIASVTATLLQRLDKAGPDKGVREVMNGIMDDYAAFYDKRKGRNLQLLEDETRVEEYFAQEQELDRLKKLFTEKRKQIIASVQLHLDSIDFKSQLLNDELEDALDEVDKEAVVDYKRNKESQGGYATLSPSFKKYLSTVAYTAKDAFNNEYFFENGEPVLQAVDVSNVYSGLQKAVAGIEDEHEMLIRMQEHSRYNVECGHFFNQFKEDLGLELTDRDFTIGKNGHLFYMVIKELQKYTPDYLFFNKDISENITQIIRANQRDAGKHQFSIWYNAYVERYEDRFLQAAPEERENIRDQAILGLVLFQSAAVNQRVSDKELGTVSLDISNLLKDDLGIGIHPTLIEYSLAVVREEDNQTEYQKRLVNTYRSVRPIWNADVMEIMRTIELDDNPFRAEADIDELSNVYAEELAPEEMSKLKGNRTRLFHIAYANSFFDETIFTSSFKNADNQLINGHQLPTFHLTKTSQISRLLSGNEEGVEWQDRFFAKNFLLQKEDFKVMAPDLKVKRISGIGITKIRTEAQRPSKDTIRDAAKEKGVTFGDYSDREFMTTLIDLYGVNKQHERPDGTKFMTTDHFIRVIEASNTGDVVPLPVTKTVEPGGKNGVQLTKETKEALVMEVRREFNRIIRVKDEIKKIKEEKEAYAKDKNFKRTATEKDGYHNTKGSAEPRGLTLFKTGSMLGALAKELEREARRLSGKPNFVKFEERIAKKIEAHWLGEGGVLDQTLDMLVKMGAIKANKAASEVYYTNVLLPRIAFIGYKTVKDARVKMDGSRNERKNELLNIIPQDFRHNLAQIIMNDFLNTNAYNQLMLGDQSVSLKDYVDMVKRAKAANAAGPSTYSTITAPELGIYHGGERSHIVQIDNPMYDGAFSGEQQDAADSQMWMTVKSMRYTLFGLGRLTPKQAEFLNKIERGESASISDIFGKGGTVSYNGQLNSIKLVYYDGPRSIKTSGILLTKELTSYKDEEGNWQPLPHRKELHLLREKLEDYERRYKTISMAVPASASKGEKANLARDISDITDWNFQELDNRFWRLQLENHSNAVVITDPTQAKQSVMAEQDDEREVIFRWSKTGDEKTETKIKVKELKELYNKTVGQRVRVKYENARDEIFEIEDAFHELGKTIDLGKVTPRLAAFQERAMNVLKSTGADSQLLEFFSLNEKGEPNYNLNFPMVLDKFTQLFFSYFSKGVLSEKVPGHDMIMVSGYGMQVLREVETIDEDGQPKLSRVITTNEYLKNRKKYAGAIDWEADPTVAYASEEEALMNARKNRKYYSLKEKLEGLKRGEKIYVIDDLRHNVPVYAFEEDGKTIRKDEEGNEIIVDRYSELIMAPQIKEIMSMAPHFEEIPDVISRAFADRIPGQDKHSSVTTRLVDFLPAYYGSSGVTAREVAEISGADFDNDKLYLSTKDYYAKQHDNGRYSFHEYGEATTTEDEFEEYVLWNSKNNEALQREVGRLKSLDDRESIILQILGDRATTLRAMKNLRLPASIEEFQKAKKKRGELNIGKLNNVAVDAKMRLLNNEHLVTGGSKAIAFQVATVKPLTDLLDKFKNTYGELAAQFEEGSVDPDSLLGKTIAFRNNKDGSRNIGSAVNALSSYFFLNTQHISIREKNGEGKPIWRLRLNGVDFDNYQNTRSYNADSKKFDGERIAYLISSVVSAMTDNTKERMAVKFGLNTESVGVVSNMIALGVPLDTAFSFNLQPIVQEYYRQIKNLDGTLKTPEEAKLSKSNIGRKMLMDLKDDLGIHLRSIEITDNILEENINTRGNNLIYQYNILDTFLQFRNQTEHFNSVAHLLKMFKGFGATNEEFDGFKEHIDKLMLNANDAAFENSMVPFDVRQVMTGKDPNKPYNHVVATYLKIYRELQQLTRVVFLERTPTFHHMMDTIMHSLNVNALEREDFQKQLKRDLLSYLGIRPYIKGLKDENRMVRLFSLTNAIIYDAGVANKPKGFLDIVHVVQAIRKISPKNYFSEKFLNAIPTTLLTVHGEVKMNLNNTDGINKAEVNTWANLNRFQIEKLQDSFQEIYQNPETRHLAWALFHYLLVKDGGQFRNGSFIRYVPNFLFKDISNVLGKVNKLFAGKYDDMGFREVFGSTRRQLMNDFMTDYLVHTNNTRHLPKIDISTINDNLKYLQIHRQGEFKDYIPSTYKPIDGDRVLEFDMFGGVGQEFRRLPKNINSITLRGFNTKKVKDRTVIEFPYVIKTEDDSIQKREQVVRYYRLESVDKKRFDKEGHAEFLDENDTVPSGTRARYVLWTPVGSEKQWKGGNLFDAIPATNTLIRGREPIINNGGYSLDGYRRAAGRTFIEEDEKKVKFEEWLQEHADIIYDFRKEYGVDVRVVQGTGLKFYQVGKEMENQLEMKEQFIAFKEKYKEHVKKEPVKKRSKKSVDTPQLPKDVEQLLNAVPQFTYEDMVLNKDGMAYGGDKWVSVDELLKREEKSEFFKYVYGLIDEAGICT